MSVVVLVLLILALACFIIAACGVVVGRLNLIALGLALCTLATLLGGASPIG